MTIIKIEPYDTGAHDNQTINGVTPETFSVPEGWAVIPESVGTPETLENYPFGEVTVKKVGGVPTVKSWMPLPVPEPDPGQDEPQYTEIQLLAQQVTDLELMVLGGENNV